MNVVSMTEVLMHQITNVTDLANIWNLKLAFSNVAGTANYSQTWQDLTLAQADGSAPANITSPIAMASFVFKAMVPAPFHGSVFHRFHVVERENR